MQSLAQSAEAVKALLAETAKTRYGLKPIPNETDNSVSDFLEAYLAANAEDRTSVSRLIGHDSASAEMLTVYSGRMAALAVRTARIRWLQMSLAAMVLAASSADDQEFTWTLPILHDAAIRMRQDPQGLFESIAGTDASGQRVMQIFRWKPEARLLKHNRAVMEPDGFRYEPLLGSTYLLSAFDWNDEPASEAALESVQSRLGRLPPEYVALMRLHNGGEGFVGEGSYLRIWPIEELADRNPVLAPARPSNVVLIGSDGSDGLYAVEPTQGGHAYLVFPRIALVSEGKKLADSWASFLETLSRNT